MLNNIAESQSQLFPGPYQQDRSLKTVDIKGAQPLKPFIRQDVYENRSLFTNDIKGAQPKANIRQLGHPQYDSSVRTDNQNFFGNRSPDVTSQLRSPPGGGGGGNSHGVGALPPSSGMMRHSYSQNHNNYSAPQQSSFVPSSPQQYSQLPPSSHAPYQPISAHDPQKNSFYNGPVADRIYKPYNQPLSQIKADQVLETAPYHRGVLGSPTNGSMSASNRGPMSSGIRPSSNLPPNRNMMSSSSEVFTHSAVLRPNHFDSFDNYNLFRQSIRDRIVRPKHEDLPDKMTLYQMNKDNIYKFQQPKLQINRDKLVQSSFLNSTQSRGFSSSSPNLPNYSLGAQSYSNQGMNVSPTVAAAAAGGGGGAGRIGSGQQHTQGIASNYQNALRPASERLVPDNYTGANNGGSYLSNQQRANSNRLTRQQAQSPPARLLSQRHSSIERNIFSKPLVTEQEKGTQYFKPYHLNPKTDVSTEYTHKYNSSSIDQLKQSITSPLQRSEATSAVVPWQKNEYAYNLIGNYVRDKRKDDKRIVNGTAIDRYYKAYDGDSITNMRKNINENGNVIPYEVKFKYHKTADDSSHYPIDRQTPGATAGSSSGVNVAAIAAGSSHQVSQHQQNKFSAGHSDIFRTQKYSIRDPVNPNKFIYAEKQNRY